MTRHSLIKVLGTRFAAGLLIALSIILVVRTTAASEWTGELRVADRQFMDDRGRVVLLRGINLAGDSKVPPFTPNVREIDLDRIDALGFNVIRLLFSWEAYEPRPGHYDESYLGALIAVAQAAAEREIYVLIDIHQDGFSRFASGGLGDGFPRWALSPNAKARKPDNGPNRRDWAFKVFLDPSTHRSFRDFYRNTHGVRSRYLLMVERIARAFSGVPGVIGYDPINEPLGDEINELVPLYRDAASVIRRVHPSAILFLEGHIITNSGIQSQLIRPDGGAIAYAPHYYNTTTLLIRYWHRLTPTVNNAFRHMTSKASELEAPLFVGEFGMDARIDGAGNYVDAIYDRLDRNLASGAQWNLTPGWTQLLKDGWNGEDFTILTPDGYLRPNYRERPYPRVTAGRPIKFSFQRGRDLEEASTIEFHWIQQIPDETTELFVPTSVFPTNSLLIVETLDRSARLQIQRDVINQRIRIRVDRVTPVSLQIRSR